MVFFWPIPTPGASARQWFFLVMVFVEAKSRVNVLSSCFSWTGRLQNCLRFVHAPPVLSYQDGQRERGLERGPKVKFTSWRVGSLLVTLDFRKLKRQNLDVTGPFRNLKKFLTE